MEKKPHRATGNPRGRPSRLPFDFGERMLKALERRLDPETGLVKPNWKGLARELGVSRSTIARQMVGLRQSGLVESVLVPIRPAVSVVCYRLKATEVQQSKNDR